MVNINSERRRSGIRWVDETEEGSTPYLVLLLSHVYDATII